MVHKIECDNCNGTGYLPEYSHVCSGKCFTCNGTGREVAKRRETTTGPNLNNHVRCFYDAMHVEHVLAWAGQDIVF